MENQLDGPVTSIQQKDFSHLKKSYIEKNKQLCLSRLISCVFHFIGLLHSPFRPAISLHHQEKKDK